MGVAQRAPRCRIEVDGAVVSDEFYSRLIRCVVVDNAGGESDTVDIELNDWPCAAIPRKGAVIRVHLGYAGAALVDMGTFTAEEIEVRVKPYTMSITGKAAETRGKAKEQRERHWDDATLQTVVSDVAADLGVSPRVGSSVGSFKYAYLAQQNESALHFLQRLAERHDAVFSIKDGNLVFVERAAGSSASGQALTAVVIVPEILHEGSCSIRFSDRTQASAVKASYTDPATGEKVDVEEASDGDGEAIDRLPEQYADEAEAKVAAKSRAKQLKRRECTFDCAITGDPTIRAGAPLTFAVGRPGVDGLKFTIDRASHSITDQGFATGLSGESQDGQGAAGG